MKKTVCVLIGCLILFGLLACAGEYGIRETSFLKQGEIINLLSQETPQAEYPDADEITRTDEPWENYLLEGLENQKSNNGLWLDDQIVSVLSKYFFTSLGTHAYIGSEWGFYVHTTVYEPGIHNVDIFLFDIEYQIQGRSSHTLSIDPILEYQYRCILDYDGADNADDSARVIRVDEGDKSLNRFFLSNVVLAIDSESANPRSNPTFLDFIEEIDCSFDGQITGDSGDQEYMVAIVPNDSTDLGTSMWIKDRLDDAMTDPINSVEFRIDNTFSTHEFFFGGWLQSAALGVRGIEDINPGSQNLNDWVLDRTYYFRAQSGEFGISPMEFAVGEVVPSPLVFGMERESQMQLMIRYTAHWPAYPISSDPKFVIEVSNETRFETQISLDILFRCEDGTFIKMASAMGENQRGTFNRYGETMVLCETVPVVIQNGGMSKDCRLYVELDGNYRFLNSGYLDESEVYIFDGSGNTIAHITESSSEVFLQSSQIYYVVAKFQDDTDIGEYAIAVWPI